MGSKLHVAMNGQFAYDGESVDAHGRSRFWGNVYNFRLSLLLAKYCGVDLVSYMGHKNDGQGTPLWMRWVRLMMYLVLSPYAYIQGLLWSREVERIDRSDPNNSFSWDNIRLNLHGDPSYFPKNPWMSKFRLGAKIWPHILPPMWMTP